MEQKQILELALQELQRQKAGIEAEIESFRAELEGTESTVPEKMVVPPPGTQRGRQRTPAERKAQAQRMREIWAARRAKAAKRADKKKSSS